MADEIRRSVGTQILRLREDAGISQRRLAIASGIPQSFLSDLERGRSSASIETLVAIGDPLGANLTIRLIPGAGPRIRDRLQAPIVEALIGVLDPAWRRLVEVPVWRPVRGVVDVVLARPGEVVIAVEVLSEVRRLEQQLRWLAEKTDSLRSATEWTMLTAGRPSTPVSRLLVLRSTRATRELARAFEDTFRASYPAPAINALAALRDSRRPWPGAAVLWAEVTSGRGRILDRPPRRVLLGPASG